MFCQFFLLLFRDRHTVIKPTEFIISGVYSENLFFESHQRKLSCLKLREVEKGQSCTTQNLMKCSIKFQQYLEASVIYTNLTLEGQYKKMKNVFRTFLEYSGKLWDEFRIIQRSLAYLYRIQTLLAMLKNLGWFRILVQASVKLIVDDYLRFKTLLETNSNL